MLLEVLARPSSQSTQVEAVVRRWYDELWNKGGLQVLQELASPDGVPAFHRGAVRGI